MKFKIAGKTEEREQVVNLDFVDIGSGEVMIVAVKANGDRISGGDLFTFKREGKVFRHACVNPHLGFHLNGAGEIVIV
jgi:hypothetical protein